MSSIVHMKIWMTFIGLTLSLTGFSLDSTKIRFYTSSFCILLRVMVLSQLIAQYWTSGCTTLSMKPRALLKRRIDHTYRASERWAQKRTSGGSKEILVLTPDITNTRMVACSGLLLALNQSPNLHFNKDNAPAAYGVIFDNFGNLAHVTFVVGHCLLSL